MLLNYYLKFNYIVCQIEGKIEKFITDLGGVKLGVYFHVETGVSGDKNS